MCHPWRFWSRQKSFVQTINQAKAGVRRKNLLRMATAKQLLASCKRHQILNEFFFAGRFDTFTRPEFRKIFNAFKSEVKFRLGKSFEWEREIYDPNMGCFEEFEAEFELEGTLDDGTHTPVKVSLAGGYPVVRPLGMELQLEHHDHEDITGFYDFGRPLHHFLKALEDAKQMHINSIETAPTH